MRTLRYSAVYGALCLGLSAISCTEGSDTLVIPEGPIENVARVAVDPVAATIVIGDELPVAAVPLDARGNEIRGRRVRWESSDRQVATVSTDGRVRAVAPGFATIMATSEIRIGVVDVQVTPVPVSAVDVTPPSATVEEGGTLQLSARLSDSAGGTLTDRRPAWASSDPVIASVSQQGLVSAHAPGVALVIAASGTKSDTAIVTVTLTPVASVAIAPSALQLATGQTAELGATALDARGRVLAGRAVSWSSSDAGIATVQPNGTVTAVAAGSATISATIEGKTGSAPVTVAAPPTPSLLLAPTAASIPAGQTVQLTAVVRDAQGNPVTGATVSWTTSNAGVATIAGSGLVTAVAPGTVEITARSNGLSAVALITVLSPEVASITVDPASANLLQAQTVQLTATPRSANGQVVSGASVAWSSSNTSIVIASTTGLVTAVGAGTAIVSASAGGKSATATITVALPPIHSVSVSPSSTTITEGQTASLNVVVRDRDGNVLTGRSCTWTSSNPVVASVSASGTVVAVAPGTVVITATCEGVSGTSNVTIAPRPVASVTVTPSAATIATAQIQQFSAVARDAGGVVLSGRPVVWASSNTGVATITQTGLATAVAAGTTTITATSDGKSGTATLTVSVPSTPPPTGQLPALPRVRVETGLVLPSGATIRVPAGGNLQGALDAAQPGDVILLEPGATYVGPFTLPYKAGAGWITVRSAAPDGALPPEGARMRPSYRAQLPKLITRDGSPVIQTAPRAHHWRLVALEVAYEPSNLSVYNYGLIRLGGGLTSADQLPEWIILDRLYVHGTPQAQLVRAVGLHSKSSAVIDSWIEDVHASGQDSQAICGWDGPGPYRIENNYLAAAGENIMFGGATPALQGNIPADIEVRRNHLHKPLAWQGVWAVVKNTFELKLAERVLVEGNVLENNWVAGQDGFMMVLKSTADAPWAVMRDVTVRYNHFTNTPGGINLSSHGNTVAERILIEHNLFTNLSGRLWQMVNPMRDITFLHNTGFPGSRILSLDQGPKSRVTIKYNVLGRGEYGIHGSGSGEGIRAISSYLPGSVIEQNLFIGAPASLYPSNNRFPASASAAGLRRAERGDFRPEPSSLLSPAAGHIRPGVDLDSLETLTRGVATPDTTSH